MNKDTKEIKPIRTFTEYKKRYLLDQHDESYNCDAINEFGKLLANKTRDMIKNEFSQPINNGTK